MNSGISIVEKAVEELSIANQLVNTIALRMAKTRFGNLKCKRATVI